MDIETYKALEKWTANEFRSVNGQIEWLPVQKVKRSFAIEGARKEIRKKQGK